MVTATSTRCVKAHRTIFPLRVVLLNIARISENRVWDRLVNATAGLLRRLCKAARISAPAKIHPLLSKREIKSYGRINAGDGAAYFRRSFCKRESRIHSVVYCRRLSLLFTACLFTPRSVDLIRKVVDVATPAPVGRGKPATRRDATRHVSVMFA